METFCWGAAWRCRATIGCPRSIGCGPDDCWPVRGSGWTYQFHDLSPGRPAGKVRRPRHSWERQSDARRDRGAGASRSPARASRPQPTSVRMPPLQRGQRSRRLLRMLAKIAPRWRFRGAGNCEIMMIEHPSFWTGGQVRGTRARARFWHEGAHSITPILLLFRTNWVAAKQAD